MFTAISKRSDAVWLVTEDEFVEGELPATARVLDLDQGKLFPPDNTHSILGRGEWTGLDPDERPDVEEMLKGVERLPHDAVPALPQPEGPERLAWKIMSGPGTIDQKREQLERLLEQFPMNWTIGSYLGDLDMEEDIENIKAGGAPLE